MSVLIKDMIPLKKILPLNENEVIGFEEDDTPKGRYTAKKTRVRNEPMDSPLKSEPTAGPSRSQPKSKDTNRKIGTKFFINYCV